MGGLLINFILPNEIQIWESLKKAVNYLQIVGLATSVQWYRFGWAPEEFKETRCRCLT